MTDFALGVKSSLPIGEGGRAADLVPVCCRLLQGAASAVGCFKTQMALYWLALAQAGLESPAAAGKALLYGAAG